MCKNNLCTFAKYYIQSDVGLSKSVQKMKKNHFAKCVRIPKKYNNERTALTRISAGVETSLFIVRTIRTRLRRITDHIYSHIECSNRLTCKGDTLEHKFQC